MGLTNFTKKELFIKSYTKTFGHITEACAKINISRQTYYDWSKADSVFSKAISDIDNSFIDLAESVLRKNIQSGMQKAVEFYLCNKKKKTYSNTIKNQLLGADDGSISVTLREVIYNVPGKPNKEDNEQPETLAKQG